MFILTGERERCKGALSSDFQENNWRIRWLFTSQFSPSLLMVMNITDLKLRILHYCVENYWYLWFHCPSVTHIDSCSNRHDFILTLKGSSPYIQERVLFYFLNIHIESTKCVPCISTFWLELRQIGISRCPLPPHFYPFQFSWHGFWRRIQTLDVFLRNKPGVNRALCLQFSFAILLAMDPELKSG